MEVKTFSVPGVPPSYNMSFKINFRLRQIYLTQEARKFKDRVAIHLPYFTVPDTAQVIINIKYHDNWYCKNGNLKKKDIQNMDKLIIDAIFKRLGIDDSQVWCNINCKIQSDKSPRTEITFIY